MTLGHFLSSEYDDIIPLAGGSGGQGTVFKARHREFDQLRAVKWLHGTIEPNSTDSSQPNKDSRLYQTFIREARNLMQLNAAYHPNVVRIYNARLIQHQGLWFPILEMELIEGTNLNTLLGPNQSGLPLAQVETLLNQMAAALAYCHRLDVIHRDIKSHNIMRDSQSDRYVLVDFGLSLTAGEAISQEQRGTPRYMSPEQYQGLNPSYQSDIYSLGVVLYEALTGQGPFGPEPSNDHWHFYSYSHLQTAVVPIRSLRNDVPLWLEKVISSCLKKDPTERFADGQALVDYLATKDSYGQPITPSASATIGQTLPAPEWIARPKPSTTSDSLPGQTTLLAGTAAGSTRSNQAKSPTKRSRWVVGASLLLVLVIGYWLFSRLTHRSPQQALSEAKQLEQTGRYNEAAEIYQELVDGGNLPAHKALFKLYMAGRVGDNDRCQKAFDLLEAAADADDYRACNLLGYVYEFGEYINRETGTTICQYQPDPEQAFHYVEKAAQGGIVEAMRQLADYYDRGFGTEADEEQAKTWRRKAEMATTDD